MDGGHVDDNPIQVQIVQGDPTFEAAAQLQQRILDEAGLPRDAAVATEHRPMRTTFHVAQLLDGKVVGVLAATIGPFDELEIRALTDPEVVLPDPVCECSSIAVTAEVAGLGVPELLYRSVYRYAKDHGAQSLAATVDVLNAEFFRNEYGVPFRNLGPMQRHLGIEMLPIGGTIEELEEGVRVNRPEFYSFLAQPT